MNLLKEKKILILIPVLLVIFIMVLLVLNFIKGNRKSIILKYGQLYLDSVSDVLMIELVNGVYNPSECKIKKDGNLRCNDGELMIETKGIRPTGGTIKISNGKIITVTDMILDGYKLETNENLKLVIKTKQIENSNAVYLIKAIETNSDSSFLGGNIKNTEIESVIIKDSKAIPENAKGSFDVSESKDGSIMAWYFDEDNNGLYEVYIGGEGGVKANPNSSWLFSHLENVEYLDLEYLDTSDVTNMDNMFSSNFSNLTSLDLSNFDTSKVVSMNNMFSNCVSLKEINLSSFNTSNVKSMIEMFDSCGNLTNLDLSNFNMSNTEYVNSMFYNCVNLEILNFGGTKFNKDINSSDMFNGLLSISKIIAKDKDSQKFINDRLLEIDKKDVLVSVS